MKRKKQDAFVYLLRIIITCSFVFCSFSFLIFGHTCIQPTSLDSCYTFFFQGNKLYCKRYFVHPPGSPRSQCVSCPKKPFIISLYVVYPPPWNTPFSTQPPSPIQFHFILFTPFATIAPNKCIHIYL